MNDEGVLGGDDKENIENLDYNETLHEEQLDEKYNKLYSRNFSDIVIDPNDPRHMPKLPFEENYPGENAPVEDILFPMCEEILRKEREAEEKEKIKCKNSTIMNKVLRE